MIDSDVDPHLCAQRTDVHIAQTARTAVQQGTSARYLPWAGAIVW